MYTHLSPKQGEDVLLCLLCQALHCTEDLPPVDNIDSMPTTAAQGRGGGCVSITAPPQLGWLLAQQV